jgi:hypothetical protein
VFGREESGLTEAELRLCAHACGIQTGRMQGSMNLSHAVAVVLCGLFERRLALLGYTENPGMDIKGEDTEACSCLSSQGGAQHGHDRHPAAGMAVTLVADEGHIASCATRSASADVPVRSHCKATACCAISAAAPTSKEKEALQPAAASEVEALLTKVSAIAEAVGQSGAESRGGGAQGSHGRRRLPLGHIRAVLSRARINAWVSAVCSRDSGLSLSQRLPVVSNAVLSHFQEPIQTGCRAVLAHTDEASLRIAAVAVS